MKKENDNRREKSMEKDREDEVQLEQNNEHSDRPKESFRERAERNRRREKKKRQGRHQKGVLGVLAAAVVVVAVIGVLLYKKYAPSRTVMPLTKYFGEVGKEEILLFAHDTELEARGRIEDGKIYLPYQVVTDYINKRFYFDASENILSYATATEIIRTEVGSTSYYLNKSKTEEGYPIVKAQGEEVYIALDFVEEFSVMESNFYKKPNRLMIEAGWGNTYAYYTVKKPTQLRNGAGIKCDILEELEENDVLRVVQDGKEELESYAKVMSADGVTGFVLKKYLSEQYEEEMKNDKETETKYPHISKEKTICMAWHQVTNQDANNGLLNTIASAKGLNVISPTWFSVTSNTGSLSSLASETYVQRAHNEGFEVWALCDDFAVADGTVQLSQLLGVTSNRDKLINRLLASALEYNLDGLNIDFENVTAETADAYLEFLRELSVKCRNNGIVLSVDSYVPTEYTAYYDREEQGKIVDYVCVMAYDEHYGGGKESGSVASIGFVEDAVKNITEMVDPSQVIIGIPFYTRLWREQNTESGVKVSSNAYGMSQADSVLSQNGATASWDETTGQNYAEFEAGDSVYKMWLEDDKSIEKKLQAVFAEQENGKVAGVAAWKLGLEKSSIWNTILKYTN